MLKGVVGDTYHISTDEVISIYDLVHIICSKLEVNFEDYVDIVGDRLGKDSAYHLSSNKLRQELNWKDKVNIDDGIDECILWIKDNINDLKNQPFNYIHKK